MWLNAAQKGLHMHVVNGPPLLKFESKDEYQWTSEQQIGPRLASRGPSIKFPMM